ncbi:MAG TPA: Uma2 family endonuclease [Gemmataceae bacterium]|nr:Uma2 family endonuclease [Gemmataceae bacterium]
MSTAVVPPPLPPVGPPAKRRMTTEEMLALPRDGKERWLIDGELREKPMTVRNRFHSEVLVSVATALKTWRDQQPEPRGKVLGGEAGVRLRRNPDLTVGVDVVYVQPEVATVQTEQSTLVEGVPALVVEILSPNDTVEEINEKINGYLSAGVPHVWIIDPYQRTLVVRRQNEPAALFNPTDEVAAEPQLPGFRTPVSRLFE